MLVATFTMAVSYFDRQALAVLAPVVTKDLGISDTQYGWLASAFSIAYLVGAPLAGRLIDLVGARRGLLGAVLLWSLVSALHAVAPGFAVLFGLRIALGLAEAPSFPGAAQTIHRVLPAAEQPRAFGVLFTGSSFGAMIIPPIATFFLGWIGWRGAFLATALVGLVWVPLWILVAHHPRSKAALDHAGDAEDASRALSLAGVLLHPAVTRTVIMVFAAAPALAFVFLWLSKYLVFQFQTAPKDLGGFLWLPPLFLDLGSLAFGDLAARRRKTRGTGASDVLLIAAAGLLVMTIPAMQLTSGEWGATLVAGLVLAGGGGLFAVLTSDMLSRVPPGMVSRAGGMTAAAQSLAYIIASPLVGWSVDTFHGYTPALYALALSVVPGVILWRAYSGRVEPGTRS